MNKRAKGKINRIELRKQVKNLKEKRSPQPTIAGIAKISCDEERQAITILISENAKPMSEILPKIEKLLRNEKFTTIFS